MQTQGAVEGLHNIWEFSQAPKCLYEANVNMEKLLLLLLLQNISQKDTLVWAHENVHGISRISQNQI